MKGLTITILVGVLGAMSLGLFHLAQGLELSGSQSDCPSIEHQHVLCPLQLAEQLATWQHTFQATTPSSPVPFIVLTGWLLVATTPPLQYTHRLKPPPVPQWQLRERTYRYTHRALQEQFAQGLLHPKLFS